MDPVILEDQTLRDGLQAEADVWSMEAKLALFRDLADAGCRRVQAGSFVHPQYVPQMADTDELVPLLRRERPEVSLSGLILNRRGLERALAAGLTHLSMSASVSEAHSQRNVRKSAAQALAEVTELVAEATAAGVAVRAGAQCAFGCVYQGAVSEDEVVRALETLAGAGAAELNLADTTGMAHPWQVARLVSRVAQSVPGAVLSLHLHDTRGLALANMHAGYQAGVRVFDVTLGGLGGCPFVKGAAGNVAAEDAAHMFAMAGIATGLDLAALGRAAERLRQRLGRPLASRVNPGLALGGGCAA